MARMSARFIGLELGKSAKEVYAILHQLGLVEKDKYGDWIVTVAGREVTGAMSRGDYSVPTFDLDTIKGLIKD
jgi:hypothetical protein